MEAELPLKQDVRGNRDNLRYGSLERSTVPKYRLSGAGRVLGLSRDFRILKSGDARREIVGGATDSIHRQKRESYFSTVPRASAQTIKARGEIDDGIQRQSNYISLSSSAKRRKLSEIKDSPFSILQNEVLEDAQAVSSEESDVPSASNNKGDAWDAFRNDVIQQRHRDLMKQTANEPQNLNAWLDLLQHQEALLRHSDMDGNSKLTRAQRHTLVAMRISIYEQALSKINHPGAHQRLVSGLMKEGSKIWDHEKQVSEWQRLLDGSTSSELRLMHLDFLMSSPQQFSCEKVLAVIVQYLDALWKQPHGSERDGQIISLILRATTFMKQAGYTERALAIWQAYIEIAYFRPTLAANDYDCSFEKFWDSECPRVGEPGAIGWAKSLETGAAASSNVLTQRDREGQVSSSESTPWVTAEKDAQRHCRLPARTLDDTADPFRIVLFTDIDQFLFFELSGDFKHELLRSFLHFCGLPMPPAGKTHGTFENDPFLCPFHVQDDEEFRSTGSTPLKPVDILSLFDSSDLYATFSGLSARSPDTLYALSVMRQLVPLQANNDNLAEYYLALETTTNHRSAPKLAKKLLKQMRPSVRLYNAYALVEARSITLTAAKKVWLAVLSSAPGVEDRDIHDRLEILRTWAWTCTAAQESAAALQAIGSSHQSTPQLDQQQQQQQSSDQLSEAEKFLWSRLSRAHSQGQLDDIAIIVDLLALLGYHVTNRNLRIALEVYEKCLSLSTFTQDAQEMPRETFLALEQLHTNRNRLIYTHTSSSSVEFRPRQIINLLQTSCHTFPQNFTFRRHLNAFTQKHGGMDRLRAAVVAVDPDTIPWLNHDSLIDHLSAIDAALNLPVEQGGTQHVVRAAFQHALLPTSTDSGTSTNVRSCPGINIAFLKWELGLLRQLIHHSEHGDGDGNGNGNGNDDDKMGRPFRHQMRQKPSKREERARKRQVQNARAAFETAVTNCPWVKDVYLAYLAFEQILEHDVDAKVWAEVYESMLERGLRICVER